MGLRKDQWAEYMKEVFRILKPGGYIQTAEIDHFEFQDQSSILPDFFDKLSNYHNSKQLCNFKEGVLAQYKPFMEAAGFVDIKIYHRSFDYGNWRQGLGSFYIVLKNQDKHQPGKLRHRRARMRFLWMPSSTLPKTYFLNIFPTRRSGVLTSRGSRRQSRGRVVLHTMCTSSPLVISNIKEGCWWAENREGF